MREIIVQQLGVLPYKEAWEYQDRLFQSIIQSKIELGSYSGPNYLLCVEHSPVFTIGKSGKMEHLLMSEEFLKEKGIEFYKNNRGGDITFHGPGQLVVYPILDLEHFFTDLKKYMRLLEEVVIQVLAEYGIEASRSEGETGVWLDADIPGRARKICAMGVRTSRWVSMHGLALNVNTDLNYFQMIVPCGIQSKGVTSMEIELGKKVELQEVFDKFVQHFIRVFDAQIISDSAC